MLWKGDLAYFQFDSIINHAGLKIFVYTCMHFIWVDTKNWDVWFIEYLYE